jgi:hypothetical protein
MRVLAISLFLVYLGAPALAAGYYISPTTTIRLEIAKEIIAFKPLQDVQGFDAKAHGFLSACMGLARERNPGLSVDAAFAGCQQRLNSI